MTILCRCNLGICSDSILSNSEYCSELLQTKTSTIISSWSCVACTGCGNFVAITKPCTSKLQRRRTLDVSAFNANQLYLTFNVSNRLTVEEGPRSQEKPRKAPTTRWQAKILPAACFLNTSRSTVFQLPQNRKPGMKAALACCMLVQISYSLARGARDLPSGEHPLSEHQAVTCCPKCSTDLHAQAGNKWACLCLFYTMLIYWFSSSAAGISFERNPSIPRQSGGVDRLYQPWALAPQTQLYIHCHRSDVRGNAYLPSMLYVHIDLPHHQS